MSTSESKKVTLKSSDGEQFVVDEAVASQSQTIKHMLEDLSDTDETPIPLPNVSAKTLSKVVQYCEKHAGFTNSTTALPQEVKSFDDQFVKIGIDELFEIIMAANYLNIKNLFDFLCQTVADMIRGMNPDEIRKTLNIENDFTAEEEEELRKENQWTYN